MLEHKNMSIMIVTNETKCIDQEALTAMGYQVPWVERDGESAVQSILKYRPDVVLCDVFLPQMDALGVLEQVRAKSFRGVFICISTSQNDALAARLMQSGAQYFLVRPFGFQYLSMRIDALVAEQLEHKTMPVLSTAPQINDQFDLESCVSELMRQIGVPAHIRGYKYIRKSILMALEDSDMLNAITKELYPGVARAYKTTPSRVERAIRHAIEVAWTRGDIEVLNSMFGYTIKTSKGKPTNGEFISMLTDRLRLTLKIC